MSRQIGTGIQITNPFDVNSPFGIDTRNVQDSLSGRNAIAYKYDGLKCYVEATKLEYIFIVGSVSSSVSDNNNWQPISYLEPDIITAGTFSKVTVNAKGRVTSGTNALPTDITGLIDSGTGKINPGLMPSISLTDTFVRNSQAAMLALTAAEQGDVCIRTDVSKSFILTTNNPAVLANWQEILTPSGGGTVTSITLAGPGEITITNPTIASSGTITMSWAAQTVNKVFASPTSGTGTPLFRTLVASDIPALDWAKITTGKPTTLSGYGITDAYYNATISDGRFAYIGGANATGTWGINISGTAANTTAWNSLTYYGGAIATAVTYAMVYDGTNNRQGIATGSQMQTFLGLGNMAYESTSSYHKFITGGVDANTVAPNTSAFTYASNAPFPGTLMYFSGLTAGVNGYGTQFNTNYSNGTLLAFRTRNGDTNTWNPWYQVYTTANVTFSVAAAGSTAVMRDASGYINNTYINTTDGVNASGLQYVLGKIGGDNYHRSFTAGAAQSWLGLGASAYIAETLQSVTDRSPFTSNRMQVQGGAGTAYNTSNIELMGLGRAPTLGFHWQGTVGSVITIESSGRIAIMNNPGTSYEHFVANNIVAAGSVTSSNWLYTSGTYGWYNSTYGGGFHMQDSSYIRTYGSKSFYCDANILAGASMNCVGYITASGGGGTSDVRHKNLQEFTADLSWLDEDRSINFTWKDRKIDKEERLHFGYSAQVINEWCPDLVFKDNPDKWALNQVELLTLEIRRLKERIAKLEETK